MMQDPLVTSRGTGTIEIVSLARLSSETAVERLWSSVCSGTL